MKGGKRPPGYTIIEVMIVLAISGVMFLIAAIFISGKQEKATFTAGVNEMASNLQDTIEQVVNGQYSDIPINCTFTGSQTSATGGSGLTQGGNSQCVFLGKMLNFGDTGGPAPDSNHYDIATLAGGRDNGGLPITDIHKTYPHVIYHYPDLLLIVPSVAIPQHLDLTIIEAKDSQTKLIKPTYAIGFLQSLGTASNGGNSPLNSGAQTVGLYYMANVTALNVSTVNALSDVNLSNTADLRLADSLDLCLTDGVQYADISLGSGNDNQLNVNVIRGKANTPCP